MLTPTALGLAHNHLRGVRGAEEILKGRVSSESAKAAYGHLRLMGRTLDPSDRATLNSITTLMFAISREEARSARTVAA